MCVAGSDKYISVVEREYKHLPLPYKEDEAFVTFPVYPNKVRDVGAKTCGCSVSYPDAKYFAFHSGIFQGRLFSRRTKQITRKVKYLLHRKQDLCQLFPSH